MAREQRWVRALLLRFILSSLGAIFGFVTLGIVAAVLMIGAVFWMYARDLPNHQELASYQP